MNRADARKPRDSAASHVRLPLTSISLFMALALGLSCFASGCGRPPTGPKDQQGQSAVKGDPWEVVAKRLRKEGELAACKSALSALNHELASGEKVEKPAALSPQAEEALAALIPLHSSDRDEIRPSAFSPHDPVYVAECLYLRDAARSLALPGLTPEQLADLGFAWVGRQVYLSPMLLDMGTRIAAAALPPTYVLRRGCGSALERMYVFLALLQQMELDGCFIGPPDPGEVVGYSAMRPDQKTLLTGGPARPFWAVGVRIETDKKPDIKLYDPWRGEAFPATFNQLKANPDAHAAWFASPSNTSGVTIDDLKKATAFLALPVNALAPRMALLEKKLKDQVDINLAIDPTALRARFPDPKPAFWNPPNDRFAYGRAARTFLPVDQGGADREPPSPQRLYEVYYRTQLPSERELTPPELRQSELQKNKDVIGDIQKRLHLYARSAYGSAFLEPPTPRERIQRGQFRDAARVLVEAHNEFSKSSDRVRHTPDADGVIRAWVDKAVELYRGLDGGTAASTALDEHWKAPGAGLLLDRSMGDVGQAEAALLLALCRHEEAERAQARFDRATPSEAGKLKAAAISAWERAAGAWRGYREQHSAAHSGQTARTEHVAALANRAKKLAQQ